jgi:hypothetical protein
MFKEQCICMEPVKINITFSANLYDIISKVKSESVSFSTWINQTLMFTCHNWRHGMTGTEFIVSGRPRKSVSKTVYLHPDIAASIDMVRVGVSDDISPWRNDLSVQAAIIRILTDTNKIWRYHCHGDNLTNPLEHRVLKTINRYPWNQYSENTAVIEEEYRKDRIREGNRNRKRAERARKAKMNDNQGVATGCNEKI